MIGSKLAGRYEILRELGRGGMGVVYLAYDPMLEREVAVKVVTPASLTAESRERFRREAKVIARMDHPAIVVVYDTGSHEDHLFFVMPFVQGKNLRVLMQERPLQLGEVLDIGIQVSEALEYSHARGIIHRDIKPENIMVTSDDAEGIRARVTDFGLAMNTTESRITRSGSVVGTIAYLSPELLSGKEVDGRSDIYSIGTVLYECFAGETPFSGEIHAVLYRIAHEKAQSLRARGIRIDEEFESLIMQCLDKDPAKRLQRARDLSEALFRYRSSLQQGDSMRIITRSGDSIDFFRPAAIPLIDREKEFVELQQRLNDSISGECQFVLIAGEAGIGKSRLLDEIENLALARKIRVLHGRFVEHDRSFPYQGFCEIIQEYFRVKSAGASSSPPDFSDLASDLTALFPVLSEISQMKTATTSGGSSERTAAKIDDRIAIFELLARSLIRIGANHPLVILLEDLHGAEVSIDALQYIIRRLGPTPTLVIGTYRTEEIDKRHPLSRMIASFQGDRRFAHMHLEPFNLAEHTSFLEALTGKVRISDSFVRQLYDATEGNPYFTRELVRSLMDSDGVVRSESGSWMLSSDIRITSETLPATIQQTVEKRIERLPENLRELVSIASVLGKTFEYRDLEILCDGCESPEEQIEQLIQDGFIEEERESRGDRLRFSSGVVCDVLYNALSRRRRKSLHRKYAEHLEKRFAGRLERVFPQLVHHYLNADVPSKVVEYGIKLALKSLSSFSAEEALRAARTVLEFIEDEEIEDRSLEGEARSLIAASQRMMANFDTALKELAAAIKVFEREQQKGRQLECMVQAAECAWEGRRVEDTRHWIGAGLDLARALSDKPLLSRLLSLGTTVANLRGEYDRARAYLEEAERLHPAIEPEEALTPGGKIVAALTPSIHATHPAMIRLDEEGEILANVFETLLTTDSHGNLVPLLCERWEVLEEGRSFLFTLRPNVRLHDGRILTAPDVKNSMENGILLNRAARRTIPAYAGIVGVHEFIKGAANSVTGILAFRENKLGIQLNEPLPLYPALLTDVRTAIAQPAQNTSADEPAFAGTGPFILEKMEKGNLILRRNPQYWRPGLPVLESIEVRNSLSASSVAAGFRSGEFDLAGGLLPEDVEEIVRTPGFRGRLVEGPRKNVFFMLFNTLSAAGADPQIRMALTGVIRTKDLVWRTLGRFAHPAEGLLPPGILGHDAGRRRQPIPHEHAAQFLKSASLPLPIKLRAAIHPVITERFSTLTSALFNAWSELGIEVVNVVTSMDNYLETAERNDGIDFMIGRYVADYDDPDNFTYGLFHSEDGIFRRYYSSPQLDQMIEEARSEMKPELRERIYRKAENHLMESGILLPLFHDVDYRLASPALKRLVLRSTLPYVNYAEVGKSISAPEIVTKKTGGGILRVPIPMAIDHLDPALTFHTLQSEVIFNIFDTLTRQAEGARTVPWLAADCRTENNGRRFYFKLRDHLRFHDGRRLTSRDVRYSFERILQKRDSQSRSWYLSPIRGAKEMINNETERLEGFKIISSTEFAIELNQPISFFPALLVSSTVSIVPEGLEEFSGSWRQGCVGTGPFRITHFEPGQRLELEPNPFYWRHGHPKSDSLIFELDVPQSDILEGFRSGRFSVVWGLPPGDVEFLRHNPQFASGYRETPSLSTYYIVLNIHEGAFTDERLRNRLFQLLDTEDLVRRKVGRLAVTAQGLIPPGLLGYEPVRRVPPASSRSGEPGEEILVKGMVHSIYDGPFADLAREILGILRNKGIHVNIDSLRADFPNALQDAKTDLIISRWIGDYPDADTFAHGLLHSQKGQMGRFCGTPELDWLIEKGRTETDPQIRHSVYREVEEMLRRHALLLPIFHEQAYRFARPEVQDFDLTFSRPNVSYEKLWLAR
jgi:ABC-type transport system substrate-binding protein/serine/threonine protein kinase